MIVGTWRASFFVPFLEKKKAPGSWNCGHEDVSCCSTMTVTANEINLISRWFVLIVRPASAENWLCFVIIWEWRED